ncbi:Translin; AltName: Full=Component 3 of promoter of RISC; Short=C3PO [Serendipita indica DSM 11827]|nr:Translin; AltName: Full=Component 3 of promoter of RISC; Short=C3PO [Serendipita indica DSM 11827]
MEPTELERIMQHMEQESAIREKMRDAIGDFEKATRVMMASLMSIHSTPMSEVAPLVDSVVKVQETCRGPIATIADLIPENQYWRWRDMYSRHIQNFVFAVALCEYVRSHRVASIQDVTNILGIREEWQDRVRIQTEDYLHGLISVANELSRLAINSVTLGDFDEPFKIHSFVADLFSGFSMLNLKNDVLRRRFDGLKYDLKRIEEVVYDLSVRKLGPIRSKAIKE